MNAKEQFPHLVHLFGSYFHQDWNLDDSTSGDVLNRFVTFEPEESIRGVVKDVDTVLKTAKPSVVVFEELGCEFDPDFEKKSLNQWLLEIRETLRHSLSDSRR